MNLGQEGGDAATLTSDTQYMQTVGTHLKFNPGSWDLSGSFYYQTGKNASARSVSAYMGSIRALYHINKTWSVNAGTDYLSGSKSSDGTYKAFNPLYGTHHKFYGAMDYFMRPILETVMLPGFRTRRWGSAIRLPLLFPWD